MSAAKVRVFSRLEDEQNAEPIEVAPNAGNTVFVRIQHPQGGSRLVSVLLGPKGGIDIARGVKKPQ